jgi:hypothetical protein
MQKAIETNNATKGMDLKNGKRHYDSNGNPLGGIKAKVINSDNQQIEVEQGEVILNRKSMNSSKILTVKGTPKQIASTINQLDGNGVAISDSEAKVLDIYKSGGSIANMTSSEQKAFYNTKEGKKLDAQTYSEWNKLVNMSKSELENFYNSVEGREAGLTTSQANEQGIDSGRESARWIIKMKDIPYKEWSSDMWRWAKKQINFIKRMSGMRGSLYNDKGEKTRKHTALLIWGHNPEQKFAEGGGVGDEVDDSYIKAVKDFEKEGFDVRESSDSKTDFGHSRYFYVNYEDRSSDNLGSGLKVRVSDHSVTNQFRMSEELHIIPSMYSFTVKIAIKEAKIRLMPELFEKENSIEYIPYEKEVRQSNLKDTDIILSERFGSGKRVPITEKVYEVKRFREQPIVKLIDKETREVVKTYNLDKFKGGGVISQKALAVETTDLKDYVRKYFVKDGRIDVSDAMQEMFGNKRGKSIADEYRKRIGLHKKGGLTISELAHKLWEEHKDEVRGGVDDSDFREAVEGVISSEYGVATMIKSLMEKSEEGIEDEEAKFWANQFDENEYNSDDEQLTDEEMSMIFRDMEQAERELYKSEGKKIIISGVEIPKEIDELFKEKYELDYYYSFYGRILNSFPKNQMGLTTDSAKATKEYKDVKQKYDLSKRKADNFNTSKEGKELIKFQGKIRDRMARMEISRHYRDLAEELAKGTEHEMEHLETLKKVAEGKITPEEAVVETAQKHLDENPNYYEDLAKMEKENEDIKFAFNYSEKELAKHITNSELDNFVKNAKFNSTAMAYNYPIPRRSGEDWHLYISISKPSRMGSLHNKYWAYLSKNTDEGDDVKLLHKSFDTLKEAKRFVGLNYYFETQRIYDVLEMEKENEVSNIDNLMSIMDSKIKYQGYSLKELYDEVISMQGSRDGALIFSEFIKRKKDEGDTKIMDEFNKTSFVENINPVKEAENEEKSEKELWEMPFNEFLSKVKLSDNSSFGKKEVIVSLVRKDYIEDISTIKNSNNENTEDEYNKLQLEKFHQQEVLNALRSGKPVPTEVVNFYSTPKSILFRNYGSSTVFREFPNYSLSSNLTKIEQEESIPDLIEGLKVLAESLEGAEKKEIEDVIEGLEILLESDDKEVMEKKSDKIKVIFPNTESGYDKDAQKFILDFVKRYKAAKLAKHADKDKNYELYVIYDNSYPSESEIYVTDSIEKAYNKSLDVDVRELNIVKAKKNNETIIYDYYNGDIFANYMGEKYDEKGDLKKEVKEKVINNIKRYFNRDWEGNLVEGSVLWATKIGEPDYNEQLITENSSQIENAKKWAMENGFDRIRVSKIDMSSKPDFTQGFKKYAEGGEFRMKKGGNIVFKPITIPL